MPPKKAKAANGDATNGDNKGDKAVFKWTPELDAKLAWLISNPRSVPASEHKMLAQKIGSFTDNSTVPTDGAIRNRIQHLRKDHRAVYEGAGLTWPGTTGGGGGGEKTSTPVKKPATPAKKRSAKTMKGDDENDENDDGDKTPVPKKQKIKTEVVDIEPEGLLGYSSE